MTAHPDSANLRMPQLERISQRSPIFVKNIEALQPLQPELAKRLQASTISDSMQSTIGRDGSPVVVLGADAHRIEWLGGSSMPSISAPAALSGFVDHGSNVALPSVGTGYECAHLLQRLLPHEAVFVCEANTERLAAALCVVDLAEQLAGGRLIFLDGDIATGKRLLRDYLNAANAMPRIARALKKGDKSLRRMLGAKGNPTLSNFIKLLHACQQEEQIRFEIRAVQQ